MMVMQIFKKKNILLCLVVNIFFIFSSVDAFANACDSTATGTWTNSATWTNCGGTFPGSSDSATIKNGHTVSTSGTSTITVTSLTIESGGILSHSDNTTTKSNVIDISAGSFDIQSGGAVNVDGKGFDGGGNSTTGSGSGGGVGGTVGESGGGGGGYGGAGGQGQTNTVGQVYGGATYGAALAPVDLGSGGGGGHYGTHSAGAGGGAVKFTVTGGGTFTLAGDITAKGQAGTGSQDDAQGGGSGGSVYINFTANGTFTGAGNIYVNGGNGGTNTDDGGGGGGGRIAIVGYNDISGFSGATQAYGGTGPNESYAGAAGTVVRDVAGGNSGALTVNNNSTTDASGETDQSDTTLTFDSVKVDGTAVYDVAGKTLILDNSTFTAGSAAATFKVSSGTFKTQSAFTVPNLTTFIRNASATYSDLVDADITTLSISAGGTLSLAGYTNSSTAFTVGTLNVSGTLTHEAQRATVLNGSHNNSTTTITVLSTVDYPTSGTIVIEGEQITYTNTTATTFTGCTRGANGTSAATHNSAVIVYPATMQSKIKMSAGTVSVLSGGSINVDSKGFAGGGDSFNGVYSGGGKAGTTGESGGGGGGYGGAGGNGQTNTAGQGYGGATYGAALAPVDLGSGGGGGNFFTCTIAGYGGGAVEIAVTGGGTFTLTGDVSAKGQAGTGTCDDAQGGGSGGSIYINFTANGTFTGAGNLYANGGSGGTNTDDGGGGGGGRIAVAGYNDISGFSGTHTAYGGSGPSQAWGGAAGTIVKNVAGGNSGDLIVDNNSSAEASGETDQSDTTLTFDTVKVQGFAVYDVAGKTLILENSTFTAGSTLGTFRVTTGTFKTQGTFTVPSNTIFVRSANATYTDTSDATLTSLTIASGGTVLASDYTNATTAWTVGTLTVNGVLGNTPAPKTTLNGAHTNSVTTLTVTGPLSQAYQSTTLSGAHTNSVATITVASTSSFPSSGIILIDSELIAYTGTTSTTFTGCTRGVKGTSAAAHNNAVTVTSPTFYGTDSFPSSGTLQVESELITYTGKTATTFTGCTRATNGTSAATHATTLQVSLATVQSKVKMSAGTITVSSTGRIDTNYNGYYGGENSAAGVTCISGGATCGGGGGFSTSGEKGGGGGSHGAAGGAGQGGATAGSTYGSSTVPIEFGSGGGGGHYGVHVAGAGGGAIELAITGGGTLTLDGTISAIGQAGTGALDDAQGGGSGGSIYINFVSLGTFAGTNGILNVSGGAGGTNTDHGGGGGGGRISVNGYLTNSTSSLTTTVSGGSKGGGTATDGSSGTSNYTAGSASRRIMIIGAAEVSFTPAIL